MRVLFGFFLLLFACKNSSTNPPIKHLDANEAYYDSIKKFTGLEFDERLKESDSLVFFFYDNPDGDVKRYTRFYTQYSTIDSVSISVISQSANKKFIRLERIKDCRSQGKIFLFEKSRPKQVLYFSNRGDSCNHIYFIKDGWFYYMDMDSSTVSLLNEFKADAVKPPS
jgi:hypothetical protein